MFSKLLIANRGEIACRAIKTARKLDIKTVAVFSEADRDALHVKMADEAVFIGPSPSAESYLVIDNIIDACKQSGAQAVYPGYGFLSENAEFTNALSNAGVVFVGPNHYAIEVMGDKIASKKLAQQAGVNVIPGYTDIVKDGHHAVSIATDIGYPVMLKASAGGGGKGMRVAYNDDECRHGFERASSEAKSSFADERIFIEKYIEQPRHIEIQVLADKHGNIVYLNERECSIQRRHQKVIEEAPSPFLDKETRKAMGEQAVALARAVDYCSAGTVEFIVDANRQFYFLEMNTRLQVEHPVTEMITGIDLIEMMLRVADGQQLPIHQTDVKINGWAMETRLYAENPFREFLPSTGRLVRYSPPEESSHVRIDSGVYEGGEVSMYYDPMIAKLITHGENRQQAITFMQQALHNFYISGVQSNIPFLNAIMAHSRFVEGKLSTNFIAEEYSHGFESPILKENENIFLVVIAATVHCAYIHRSADITGQLQGHERLPGNEWVVVLNNKDYHVHIDVNAAEHYIAQIDTENYRLKTDWQIGQSLLKGRINETDVTAHIDRQGFKYTLVVNGACAELKVLPHHVADLNKIMPVKLPLDMSKFLLSPMPGLLVSLNVEVGQEVKAGEELAIIEAMKMENSMRADQDGKVVNLLTNVGATLEVDQPIIEFE